MFDKPILIYSEYCQYSNNFLKTLMKHPELFDSFIRMCIDTNSQTKRRPEAFYEIQKRLNIKITKVPTIITPGPTDILSDKDAFKWLEYQIQHLSKNTECTGFNKNEMTSLSDSYANFGSTDLNDATAQSYQFFINKELPDDNYLNTTQTWGSNSDKTNGFLNNLESESKNVDYATKQNERQFFDDSRQRQPNSSHNIPQEKYNKSSINQNDFNSFAQQRNTNKPTESHTSIDFTNPNFGLSGKLSNNNNSVKAKELDARLNQLLQDRKLTDNKLQNK